MVLASVGILDEVCPLLVHHPRTLQLPRSRNHIPSTASDTVTYSDRSYYLQRWILDIPLHHQLLLGEEDQLTTPSHRPPRLDSKVNQIVLDEFVLTQVIPISMHTEIFVEGLQEVPIASNPTFARAMCFNYAWHPTTPVIPPECFM